MTWENFRKIFSRARAEYRRRRWPLLRRTRSSSRVRRTPTKTYFIFTTLAPFTSYTWWVRILRLPHTLTVRLAVSALRVTYNLRASQAFSPACAIGDRNRPATMQRQVRQSQRDERATRSLPLVLLLAVALCKLTGTTSSHSHSASVQRRS